MPAFAAFGVGPLENMVSLALSHIFAATALPSIGLAILAFVIARTGSPPKNWRGRAQLSLDSTSLLLT